MQTWQENKTGNKRELMQPGIDEVFEEEFDVSDLSALRIKPFHARVHRHARCAHVASTAKLVRHTFHLCTHHAQVSRI